MAKQILVKDVMHRDVVTCSKTDTVQGVARIMKEHSIGVVVVTNKKNKIEGIISERDILCKVVCEGIDSRKALIQDIMTKKVVTGKPSMNDIQVASIFSQHKIKKLPIVEKNRLVGIVTQTDLLKLLSFKWAL